VTADALTEILIIKLLHGLEPSLRPIADAVLPSLRPALVRLVQERYDRQCGKVGYLEPMERYSRVIGLIRTGHLPEMPPEAKPVPIGGFYGWVMIRRRCHPLDPELKQYAVVVMPFGKESHAAVSLLGDSKSWEKPSYLLPDKEWHATEKLAAAWFILRYNSHIHWITEAPEDDLAPYWGGSPWPDNEWQILVPMVSDTAWIEVITTDVIDGNLIIPADLEEDPEYTQEKLDEIGYQFEIYGTAFPPINDPSRWKELIKAMDEQAQRKATQWERDHEEDMPTLATNHEAENDPENLWLRMRYLLDRLSDWDREMAYGARLTGREREEWQAPDPARRTEYLNKLRPLVTAFSAHVSSDVLTKVRAFDAPTWAAMRHLVNSWG